MLTHVGDTNEYAEQELIDHFLLNAMGQPKDPPLDKEDFIKVHGAPSHLQVMERNNIPIS